MKKSIILTASLSFVSVLTASTVHAAVSCRSLYDRELPAASKRSEAIVEKAKEAKPISVKKDMVNSLLDAELGGIPESKAFVRSGVALEGNFKAKIEVSNDVIKTIKATGKTKNYGGVEYIEFPNSTSMTTVDPTTGQQREFMLTRGVKLYEQKMNSETGTINPQGYVSDVLLFERVAGKSVFIHRVLASKESTKFFFEDPRISVINIDGQPHYFLSGTDYSSHRPDSIDPDVMNRYVELEIDRNGLPLAPKVDPQTGKPEFFNLSPAPKKTADGWAFVDAKNGTIAQNEAGEIVVRTRMRPDFGNKTVKEMAGDMTWHYAEQVFTFKNWEAFKEYNWNDALIDLFGKRGQMPTESAEGPTLSKVIMLDTQMKEHLTSKDPSIEVQVKSKKTPHAKGKGMGPGTRPVRIQRIGDELFMSDGPGAVAYSAGVIPAERRKSFSLKEGEVTYVTFDHEIRYLKQQVETQSLLRRHYTGAIKFFDASLTKIISYRPDAIQPKTKHELGFNSGITDLLHVYPMGVVIVKVDGKYVVRVYAGASDAHTTMYDFNVMDLMLEMQK